MKDKTLLISAGILAIAIVILLISSSFNGNAIKEEEIKIGVVAPLSGPGAWFGGFVEEGIDLKLSELPKSERSRIKLIWEDGECLAQPAIDSVNKLILIDNVEYIIGPFCNVESISTEYLFDDNQVVSMKLGMSNRKLSEMGQYHFSFLPQVQSLMGDLANHAYNDKGSRRIGIITLDDFFGHENQITFKEKFESLGGEIVSEEFFLKSTLDVRSQLIKIKATNPDGILLAVYGPVTITILEQMQEIGLDNIQIYGINTFEVPAVLEEVSDFAEGAVYPIPADKNPPKSVEKYSKEFKDKYGRENGVYSANGYDTFSVLLGAINSCGHENQDCVIEELSSLRDYEGANGLLSVDENGIGIYDGIMLKTVKNGKFVPI